MTSTKLPLFSTSFTSGATPSSQAQAHERSNDASETKRMPGSARSQVRVPATLWRGCSSKALVGTRVVGGASNPTEAPSGANDEALVPKQRQEASRVCKRSYKRALRRAAIEGSAIYRGRRIRFWQPTLPQEPRHDAQAWQPPRISCITWNCSGLSMELFLELQVWLGTKPEVGFFMLQETHWSLQGEWTSGDWYILHSAALKPKQGGILLGIRKTLLNGNYHSWNEIVPGRLLHWRGHLGKQQVDLFNLYQHSLSHHSDDQKKAVMGHRKGLWQKLDKAIGALPFRTSIILMGDFNMVMQPHPKVAGFGIHSGNSVLDLRQERAEVMEMLERHRLTVLNTWGRKNLHVQAPFWQLSNRLRRHSAAARRPCFQRLYYGQGAGGGMAYLGARNPTGQHTAVVAAMEV